MLGIGLDSVTVILVIVGLITQNVGRYAGNIHKYNSLANSHRLNTAAGIGCLRIRAAVWNIKQIAGVTFSQRNDINIGAAYQIFSAFHPFNRTNRYTGWNIKTKAGLISDSPKVFFGKVLKVITPAKPYAVISCYHQTLTVETSAGRVTVFFTPTAKFPLPSCTCVADCRIRKRHQHINNRAFTIGRHWFYLTNSIAAILISPVDRTIRGAALGMFWGCITGCAAGISGISFIVWDNSLTGCNTFTLSPVINTAKVNRLNIK